MNTYNIYDSSISFKNVDDEVTFENSWDGSLPHYRLFEDVMHELSQNGFYVELDKKVDKCIRKDYYSGSYHDLNFKAHRYPAGFEIEFYQEINFKNPNGGQYDFDKLEKMPYLIKLIFLKTIKKISAFLDANGVACVSKPVLKTSEEKIKYDYVKSCHYPQKDMNFSLSDLDGTTCEYSYNNQDRDHKTVYNGQVKFYRDNHGYLARGKVYHDLNNMWWVIINDSEYHRAASFELFDISDSDARCRVAEQNIPKAYAERKKKLLEASTKELLNELKRRKIKAS